MNKEIQQKYIELQFLNQQIKQTQNQIETLQQQLVELTAVNQNLDDFKNIKIGTETFIQINNGIFAKGTIKDNKGLIVNVGANIAVKKDIPSTKKLIGDQIEQIKMIQQQKLEELQGIVVRANLLEKEISRLIGKRD